MWEPPELSQPHSWMYNSGWGEDGGGGGGGRGGREGSADVSRSPAERRIGVEVK